MRRNIKGQGPGQGAGLGPGKGPAKGKGTGGPARAPRTDRSLVEDGPHRNTFTTEQREELQARARELAASEGINFVRALIRVKREALGIAPSAPSPNRKDFEELATLDSQLMLDVLVEVATDETLAPAARVAAANSHLEFAMGRHKEAAADPGDGATIVIKGGLPDDD